MGLTALLLKEPLAFIVLVVPLLYSVIIHEMSHGIVAYLFGDDTALRSGRFSLNPLRHLDPFGTLMLFVVGFGWAKPVPVNYFNLRNFRLGLIFVSLAGCLANIIIAAGSIFLLQFERIASNAALAPVLLVLAQINIILGAFNLIPIPPLDGSKILMGFLPAKAQRIFIRLEPYGLFILIALLFTGLLDPVIILVQKLIIAVILIFVR